MKAIVVTAHQPSDHRLLDRVYELVREQGEAYLIGQRDRESWEAEAVAALRTAIGDHVPSGHEDMSGYGQVTCSCGEWDSSEQYKKGYLSWPEHIIRAAS